MLSVTTFKGAQPEVFVSEKLTEGKAYDVIKLFAVVEYEQPLLIVTVNIGENTPLFENVVSWLAFVDVCPFPKLQAYEVAFVISVEKVVAKGAHPDESLAII